MIICQYVNNLTQKEYIVFIDAEALSGINVTDYARPGFTFLGASEAELYPIDRRGLNISEEDCYLLDR